MAEPDAIIPCAQLFTATQPDLTEMTRPMIAQLSPAKALTGDYQQFLAALKDSGFRGEISADYASRVVLATDNSIYQRLPQAAVFPLDAEDVARVRG